MFINVEECLANIGYKTPLSEIPFNTLQRNFVNTFKDVDVTEQQIGDWVCEIAEAHCLHPSEHLVVSLFKDYLHLTPSHFERDVERAYKNYKVDGVEKYGLMCWNYVDTPTNNITIKTEGE